MVKLQQVKQPDLEDVLLTVKWSVLIVTYTTLLILRLDFCFKALATNIWFFGVLKFFYINIASLFHFGKNYTIVIEIILFTMPI